MKTTQASQPQPTALRVAAVMTPRPVTCHPDDYLLDAAARMEQNRVRHLPVVDGRGALLGMLSDRDVRDAIGDPARWMEDSDTRLEDLRVGGAMSTPALTISVDRPLSEAIQYLVDREVSALPVVDHKGILAGILSYIDILKAFRGPPPEPPIAA